MPGPFSRQYNTESMFITSTGSRHKYYPLTDGMFWHTSPRVGGKLQLRANTFSRKRIARKIFSSPSFGTVAGALPELGFLASQQAELEKKAISDAYTMAYARLRGKLYEGNASLGVTFAEMKSSREMVVKRSQQLANDIDKEIGKLARVRRKDIPKHLAGLHLEVIFGWTPLLADIHAAVMTVIQGAEKRPFVTSRGKANIHTVHAGDQYDYRVSKTLDGRVSVTLSTRVRIANPNLWLLERAGLLNPAAVAWDLVPFSFVLNMFVNVNSLVNSITDFAGLEFDDLSRTDTVSIFQHTTTYDRYTFPRAYGVVGGWEFKKSRTLPGTLPSPNLQFRIPEMSWELAAMAASLVTQKIGTLSRLVGALRKP